MSDSASSGSGRAQHADADPPRPRADIRARLEIGVLGEQQRAGDLFGVRVPWIGVLRESGATYLTYANAGVETRGPRIEGKSVILRAEVSEAQTVEFSYAQGDDAAFERFGPVTPLAGFSLWKGSRPAVFTYIRADVDEERAPPHPIAHNYVDVDWFRVPVPPR